MLRGDVPKDACGLQGYSLKRCNPRIRNMMNRLIRGVKAESEQNVFIFVSKKRLVWRAMYTEGLPYPYPKPRDPRKSKLDRGGEPCVRKGYPKRGKRTPMHATRLPSRTRKQG